MGYRLLSAMTEDDAALVGYSGTQLGRSIRATTSTESESIKLSITLTTLACVVAAQRQLAALISSPRG